MGRKTLVKAKIVLEKDGRGLTTYLWKKTFWFLGYWYPWGTRSGTLVSPEKLAKINDNRMSKVLYNEFITGN